MASQTVVFEYDKERNILFANDDYEITTDAGADAFLKLYRERLEQIGHRVYIVTSIDGLRVGGKVYAYYGTILKALADKWYLGIARWGTDPTSRMTVRSASLKGGYEINIFDSREKAIESILQLQKAGKGS
jgi:hypothetical protein